MAFNFMSFLGGAAEQLTDVIETREAERMYEERQVKAEEREERRFAKRQAAAAARDRKKAEEEASELASALSVFYSPDRVKQIMAKGKTAAKWYYETGGKLAEKGLATEPLFNPPKAAAPTPIDVGGATPAPAPTAPSLTEAEQEEFATEVAEQAEVAASPIPSGIPARQSSVNFGYLAKAFAPADDEQASLDAAYAVASQKARNATTEPERLKYENLALGYLQDIYRKDQMLKDEGKDSDAFSMATINTNLKGFYDRALGNYGLQADLKTGIIQGLAGKLPENQSAIIEANMQVQLLNRNNGQVVSQDAENLFKSNVKGAVRRLQAYGMRQAQGLDLAEGETTTGTTITDRRVNTLADPIDASQLASGNYKYKVGDVLFVREEDGSTSVRVYTGLKVSPMHNMFVNAGKING